MEDFVTGNTGSGKPSSINVPDLQNVDAASLTLVSAKEPVFNPFDPLPSPLSIEDAKAMAASLVLPPGNETQTHTPTKADEPPDRE